jgi:YidC/Oxa1 family membrane protein insertase
MAESSNKDTQFRFLIAAVLSMAVLFGWTYFFPGPKVDPNDANSNTAQVNSNTATPTAPELAQQQPNAQQTATPTNDTPDANPNKEITVKTPLYQVKLDSKGAVATSWILLKNISTEDRNGKLLFADGSTKDNEKPLELVSQEGLKREPREAPFRLSTGDQNLDIFLNQKNYQVSVNQENVELTGDQTQQVDYVLKDEANGLEITKTFTFRADSYLTDLQVKLTRNGQTVPNTKLLIGSSVGDQGINHYNFYQVEPEGVATVDGKSQRFHGTSIIDGKEQGQTSVPGNVDWAGIGDTYFAMAAIPAQPTQGLEYRASKYEVEINPVYTGLFSWITRRPETKQVRHLLTAYVPIAADGSTTKIYTGTKDYFVLNQYNKILSENVGRTIDIEDFINYGWFHYLTKPLSVPILYALNFLYNFTQNYGISIIIFTLLFYSLLFPLRWYQSKSFKKSAANAPKMKELQDKMKEMQKKGVPADDPKMRELQMQQLKMTKDALPIGGCLPMLLQFPLLIALYITVSISLGFRQASFLWLPDLSAGDPWHILEFGFAFSMILSMKFSPTSAPVTPEQQMQQKLMTYLMPVMMLFIMWSAPAGLLLYWFAGNIVSFVQQLIINYFNKTPEPPAEQETAPVLSKKRKPKLSTS